MSRFALVSVNGSAALISDSPVIKRSERADYQSSADLLLAAAQIRNDSAQEAERARTVAYAEAAEAASADFAEEIKTKLQNFAADLDRDKAARNADIADAAFAAVKAILGEIEAAEMMQAMVVKTLANLEKQDVLAVHLSPEMAATIAPLDGIEIAVDQDFGPYDCRVVTADSRIIASLSVQLDTLAKRWGVTVNPAGQDENE